MRRKLALILAFGVVSSIFACAYNEINHTISECSKYSERPMPAECKKAHSDYNSWVFKESALKAKDAASRVGNKVMKFVGEKMNENASDKVSE